ncbi:(2Fe-2S)-binding protein [Tenggerimyces flavus]|uniref:(2Fe-2S)-binding protein n=1 Tax=Tenggerimyces flavus TaxID=1708749 RepID=A0ABV7Y5B2_9ACTN|nr:(2Fe-2S)-binding protein [Tenggerimyces flavus]MBM7788441.1 hypothetical protein [Tenggerimyces flavus]
MEVFAELAAVGEYFAVDVGPSDAPPLAELYAGGRELDARIERVCAQLGTDERRVGASIWFQGLAARLWSPVVGAAALGLDVPAIDPATTRWDGGRLQLANPTTGGKPSDVLDHHLEPLVATIKHTTNISAKLLWGNAASALAGTVKVLLTARPNANTEPRDQLLQDERLAGAGHFGEPGAGFRRTTCCLFYRVPNGGLCGDCVLVDRPPR